MDSLDRKTMSERPTAVVSTSLANGVNSSEVVGFDPVNSEISETLPSQPRLIVELHLQTLRDLVQESHLFPETRVQSVRRAL